MISKFFRIIVSHKIIAFLVVLALAGGVYYGYNALKSGGSVTRYVMAAVKKDLLTTSVSGSGQVSASNQVDIKPKVSGDIITLGVKEGQEVKAGALIVQLDARDAGKTVRDAETSLETAQLSLEKLKQPADELSLIQTENALTQAKNNLSKLKFSQETDYQKAVDTKQNAENNLAKAYDDGFNTVSSAFLDIPAAVAGLQDILFSFSFQAGQWNIDYYTETAKIYDEKALQYKKDAYDKYQVARQAYDKNFQDYKSASRLSDRSVIEALIDETYETTRSIAEAVKSANNLIQFYEDKLTERNLRPPALANTHLSSLSAYTGKTNSHLLSLLGIKNTIKTNRDAISDAQSDLEEMERNNPLDLAATERSVQEKEASLAKLKSGPDALDIRSQELTIKQREIALSDAKEKLADYYVRVPFDGVIAELNSKKGDSASSATVIAVLMTKQKIAEISLNEVDAAKVKAGQKAMVTFDAIEGLTISGAVAGIDAIGTVTQGVVNYSAKIGFDTQDERVKSGMSASVSIITEAEPDALVVPTAAVKSQNDAYYVEIPDETVNAGEATAGTGVVLKNPSRRQTVETGLSNDTMTEIKSGLKEGDLVILKTVSASAKSTPVPTRASGGGFRIPGL